MMSCIGYNTFVSVSFDKQFNFHNARRLRISTIQLWKPLNVRTGFSCFLQVYAYIYMRVYVCVYIYMYIYIYMYMYVYVYIYIYIYMYVYVYV